MANRFDTLKFVATDPVPEILKHLATNVDATIAETLAMFGAPNSSLGAELMRRNLAATPDGRISARGRVCWYCVQGIEGSDLPELVDKLRSVDPASSRISLVREGMTTNFVEHLRRADPLRRVMICSPWVNLDRPRLQKFVKAVETTEKLRGFRPEITVVTRPMSEQPDQDANQTLAYLRRINAVIIHKAMLHSKLYIVEAGESTVLRLAFVGSENFTKVRYQELGIFVDNDNQLIDDLTRYFLSLDSR